MSVETQILLSLLIPAVGALGIALAGRVGPNVRETVTLVTAGALAWNVWQIVPVVFNGGRPGVTVTELVPGIDIAFRVEPLGMLFAALASSLWIVNSVYSIGHMRVWFFSLLPRM